MIKRLSLALVAALTVSVPAFGAEDTIVVLGDSLSSGYGMRAEQSWVSLLEDRLEQEAYGYDVVNASIAGDTTSGGLARLPRLLETHEPGIVIIELGGNDGLRGQPVATMKRNLERMIELAQEAGAEVVLAGIQIPPNYGPAYTAMFRDAYSELAQRHGAALVPFLMDGAALNPELMQSDSLHPNAAGQPVLFRNVWQVLEDLL